MCGWEEEDNDLFTVRLEESWDFIYLLAGLGLSLEVRFLTTGPSGKPL